MRNEEPVKTLQLRQTAHIPKPYTLPVSLELRSAFATVSVLFNGTADEKRRYRGIGDLHVCANELLSLQRNYGIGAHPNAGIREETMAFIPADLSFYLNDLSEEQYLSYPIEALEGAVDNIRHFIYDLLIRLHLDPDDEEIDLDYIDQYVPRFVKMAVIDVIKNKTTFADELKYDQIVRVKWLAELVPYPANNGSRFRSMMELITLATGLTFDEENQPVIHTELALEPLYSEITTNSEFQRMVNEYLLAAYNVTFDDLCPPSTLPPEAGASR